MTFFVGGVYVKAKFLIFFTFILFLVSGCFTVYAQSTNIKLDGHIPYSYQVRDIYGNLTIVNYGKYIYANNEIAFCVQPGVLVDESASYEINLFTHSQRTEMERIAYAGWHASDKTVEDYLATQFYIWEKLGATIEDTSLTDYLQRKNIIKQRVQLLFHSYPEFANTTHNIAATKAITLNDTNNIFRYYTLKSKSEGIRIEQNENSLKIAAANSADANAYVEFQLVEDKYSGTSMVYQSSVSQSVVPFKVEVNRTFKVHLNVSHANLIIEKKGSDYKPLENVSFRIAKDEAFNNVVGTYQSDELGCIVLKKVSPGTYYVQELNGPDNIKINSKIEKVNVKAGENCIYRCINQYRKIILEKYDEDNNLIPNVSFAISNKEDMSQILGVYKTGSDGRVEIDDIWNYKNIYIQEKEVPYHLQLDEKIYKLTLTPNKDTTYKAVNEYSLQKLTIMKKGSNNKRLGDVSFKLSRHSDMSKYIYFDENMHERTDGKGSSTLTTNQYGVIEAYVKPGVYYLQECLAPDNLVLNQKIYKVIVEIGKDNKIEITNDYRKIILEKQDEKGNLIPNVIFEIGTSSSMEKILGTYQTESDGRVEIDDIWNYSYVYIREIKVPSHLQLNNTVYRVKLNPHQNTTYVAINKYAPQPLHIFKKDPSGLGLANVSFKISRKSDMSEYVYFDEKMHETKEGSGVSTITTNSKGKVSVYLQPGIYYIQECVAPNHLVLNSKIKKITVNIGESVTYEMKNDYRKIILEKRDEKGNLVANVSFEIGTSSSMEKILGTYQTGSNGQVEIDDIWNYNYLYIREVKVPSYLQLNDTIYRVKLNPHQNTTYVAVNELKAEPVYIKKVDEDGNPLANVAFKISRKSDMSEYIYFDENMHERTDGKGISTIISSESGYCKVYLKPGTYYVQEIIAPEGYMLDDKIQSITVVHKETHLLRFYNDYTQLHIIKLDEQNERLPNVQFEISKDEDFKTLLKFDENGVLSNEGSSLLTTNDNGKVVLKKLSSGIYYLREIGAPESIYFNKDKVYTINLAKNQKLAVKIENRDRLLRIVKKSENQTLLPGAVYMISRSFDMSNPLLFDGLKESNQGLPYLTTNQDGEIMIKGLVNGTYYLQEQKAPNDYILDTKIYKIELTSNQDYSLVLYNRSLGIKIYKVNSQDIGIKGVKFQLSDDKNFTNILEEGITNEEGILIFEHLLEKTYYVREVSTLNQYILDTKVHEVKLSNHQIELKIVNENRKGHIYKYNESNIGIKDVTFGIYEDENCEKLVTKVITDEKGYACFDAILDFYYVKELSAPSMYCLDEKVHRIAFDASQDAIIKLHNKYRELVVLKKDDLGVVCPGVLFGIYEDEQCQKLIYKGTTNEQGILKVAVRQDIVYIKELATPKGLVLDTKVHKVLIQANQDTIIECVNERFQFYIVKLNEEDIILEGVLFVILDASNEQEIARFTSSSQPFNASMLEANKKYILRELKALDGYEKANDIEFIAKHQETLKVYNKMKQYQLTIHKLEEYSKKHILSKCEFGLYRDEACLDCVETLVSENGIFVFKNLKPGTYYVKELKAPSGYALNSEVVKVELLNDEKVDISITNKKVIPETGITSDALAYYQLLKWFAYFLLSMSMLVLMKRFYRSI